MKMKILFMTLVLALMLMSGSALKCYQCSMRKDGKCHYEIETCKDNKSTCFSGERFSQICLNLITFKRCMPASLCYHLLKRKDYRDVKCCVTNFCN
ncbi:hypothetical protein Q7C36_005472 [Tachysurus vachellii]|uniref:Snake toxin/toxin-like domain-containing protein n=1 Tax=Tachysurus vachellii TaxID=175792 RepID=A0AA88NKS8_TACVA|nr:hypothetical protein Q7C36_005472 [Tachysurus vachellii]